MQMGVTPPFFEVAADTWSRYQQQEFGSYVEPEVLIELYRGREDEFRRAVGWSLARGFKQLRLHPEDAVKKQRREAR